MLDESTRSLSVRRPCRVKVEVISLESSTNLKDPNLTLKIEGIEQVHKDMKTYISLGTETKQVMNVTQSFIFDIENWNNAELKIKISSKYYGIQRKIGKINPIKICDFVHDPPKDNCEANTYEFFKDGVLALVKIKLKLSILESGQEKNISVFIGTWNIGNSEPQKDLKSWLNFEKKYELIAIGVQEFVYLPIADFEKNEEDWINTLQTNVGKDYELLIKPKRSWQIMLCVFVRKDVKDFISEIFSDDEATGIGHVVPNKGGVCISLKFLDTSICFITSHFAAHEGFCEDRNKNYQEIVSQLRSPNDKIDVLHHHHYLFWFGDLNYRFNFPDEFKNKFCEGLSNLNSFSSFSSVEKSNSEKEIQVKNENEATQILNKIELSAEKTTVENQTFTMTSHIENFDASETSGKKHKDIIKERIHNFLVDKITKNEFKELFDNYDELKKEMESSRVFFGFKEGDVNFPPTFRMEREFENKYNSKRFPAFCDRILFRHFPTYQIKQIFYKSFPSVKSSDHKPVSSAFEILTRSFPLRDNFQLEEKRKGTNDIFFPSADDVWIIEFDKIAGNIFNAKSYDGFADPYLKFFGPVVNKSVCSKTFQNMMNPIWKKDDIPNIILKKSILERLKFEFLHFQMFDKSFSHSKSLGFGMISLYDSVEKLKTQAGEYADFESDVMYEGLPAGKINGRIRLSLTTMNSSISKKEIDFSELNASLSLQSKDQPELNDLGREGKEEGEASFFVSASHSLDEGNCNASVESNGKEKASRRVEVEEKVVSVEREAAVGDKKKLVQEVNVAKDLEPTH